MIQTSVAPAGAPFTVRVICSEYAWVDNVSLFDSEEDGATIQGVVFWASPTGRAGFAVRAPVLVGLQNVAFSYNGYELPAVVVNMWLVLAGMRETAVLPWLGGQAPGAALTMVAFESTVNAVITGQGAVHGLEVMTSAAQSLLGTVTP